MGRGRGGRGEWEFLVIALTFHRYVIHLWDMHHDGTWENRSTYTYYAELVLELAALSVEFLHHVHMLVRSTCYTMYTLHPPLSLSLSPSIPLPPLSPLSLFHVRCGPICC